MRINFENDTNISSAVNSQSRLYSAAESAKTSEKNKDTDAFAISIGQSAGLGIGSANAQQDTAEWQQELDASDVQIKRDYMSVMSLSMSDEDYAALVSTGEVPEDMDATDAVTIIDEIKAAVIRGGKEISGYTDTVDRDALAEITGSEAAANELVKSMAAQDAPITDESLKAAAEAVQMAGQVVPPAESAMVYLMDNGKAPTIQNLYEATYSGRAQAASYGGYISQDGYLSTVAAGSQSDIAELMPQIENVITESGLEVNDDTRAQAVWLINNGLGLTAENLLEEGKLRSIQNDNIVNAVSIAMGAGIEPKKANLTYTESIYTMAEKYYAEYMSPDKDLEIEQNGADSEADGNFGEAVNSDGIENIRGRRQLEEIRLTMTVEANRLLLRSNFQIDIAPMEELIEALKTAEQTINSQRFPSDDESVTESRAAEYKQASAELSAIPGMPAAILGETTESGEWRFAGISSFSLHDVYEAGVSRSEAYTKAGEAYETLMTSPRYDLGDSIKKAFRNVDDILEDLDLETDDENRRAVRILGYNSMEVNTQNIAQIREADESLRRTIDRLTPSRVIGMIRDDANPLNMTVSELGSYLDEQDSEPEKKAQNYAKFLMQLEKQDEITELERDSYIGIYRMLSSLDRTDDAAVGAIINTGAEISFANMLSAMRSAAKTHMDYKISDEFGSVTSKYNGAAIDTQINAAFSAQTAGAAAAYGNGGNGSGEADTEGSASAETGYSYDEITRTMLAAETVSDEEIEAMITSGINVSLNNIEVSDLFRRRKGDWFETVKSVESDDSAEAAIDDTLEAMTDSESAILAYDEMLEGMKEQISDAALGMDTYIDVRAMQSSMRQISFLQKQARNEDYMFPADIDGETTNIRLQIRHRDGAGELTITMETENLGKLAAQFNLGASKSGFIAYEKSEGSDFADSLIESMSEYLPFVPEKINAPEMSLEKFTEGSNSSEKTSKKINDEAQESDINSTELYRIARLFIGKARG